MLFEATKSEITTPWRLSDRPSVPRDVGADQVALDHVCVSPVEPSI